MMMSLFCELTHSVNFKNIYMCVLTSSKECVTIVLHDLFVSSRQVAKFCWKWHKVGQFGKVSYACGISAHVQGTLT